MLYYKTLSLVEKEIKVLDWIVDVIRSCETPIQLNNAMKLLLNYEKRCHQVPVIIRTLDKIHTFAEYRMTILEGRKFFSTMNPVTCN